MVEYQDNKNNNSQEQNTWSLYLYALKSPVARQKNLKKLEKLFDSLGMGYAY